MKMLLVAIPALLLAGCFAKTVYVREAQAPLPVLPRPAISVNPTTEAQLRQDRERLKADILLWEGIVLERNRAILEANQAEGYPVDPDSIYPRAADGRVIRTAP